MKFCEKYNEYLKKQISEKSLEKFSRMDINQANLDNAYSSLSKCLIKAARLAEKKLMDMCDFVN